MRFRLRGNLPIRSSILASGLRAGRRGMVALTLAVAAAGTPALASPDTATSAQFYLSFSPAPVGVPAASAAQMVASFAVIGPDTTTATLHYGIDFSAGPVACTPNLETIGQTCTVQLTFIPTLPGAREDSLFLMDGTTILATVYLGGVGLSAQAMIQPGVVTQLVSGSAYSLRPRAVDEEGTVYLDIQNSAGTSNVYSVSQAGALTTVPVAVNTSSGIAIDGAGILYINAGNFNSQLTTWNTVTQTQGSLVIAPPSPFPCTNPDYLNAVTADSLANLFVLENDCQQVIELGANGTYTINAFNPEMNGTTTSIALDSADDVFFSSQDQVNELLASGGQSSLDIAGAGGGSTTLAVDPAGSLYAIPDFVGNFIAELPAPDYQTVQATLDPSVSPQTFALGSDGALYVGYFDGTSFTFNLDKVDRSQGAIAFGQQSIGTATAAQTEQIYNGGNEPLILTDVELAGASLGFSIQPSGGRDCTNDIEIGPGSYCEIAVTLTPAQAGNLAGTVTFYTNSLNNRSSTETVALSGFVPGPAAALSPTSVTFANQAVNTTSAAAVLTLTNTGDQPLTDIVIGLGGTNPTDFNLIPGANACGTSLAVGSNCAVYAIFTPQAATTYFATVSVADNASGSPQTAMLTGTGVQLAAVMNVVEPIQIADAPALAASAVMNVVEAIHIGDAPALATSAVMNVVEAIHIADAPALSASAVMNVVEAIHIGDAPALTASAVMNVIENIHTTDVPALAESVALNIAEVIHTSDAPAVGLAATLNIAEVIHSVDGPGLTPSTALDIAEIIHTSDAPAVALSAALNIAEVIRTLDAPLLTPSAALNIAEVIHATDMPTTMPSAELQIAEVIHTSDAPAVALSAALNIAEVIRTLDAPMLTPSAALNIAEVIHATDMPAVTPSAELKIAEVIHTSDAPAVALSAALNIAEVIRTLDSPLLMPSAALNIAEVIHTSDMPAATPSAELQIAEVIHTSDAPAVALSAALSIAEVIRALDSPPLTPSAALNIAEVIHTTDIPAPTPSAELQIAEIIHTTDAPAVALSAALNIAEVIRTLDSPLLTPSAALNIAEVIHTIDMPTEMPSTELQIAEIIHTSDSPAVALAVALNTAEVIHAVDAPFLSPSVALNIADVIHTTDMPVSASSVALNVFDVIHTVDTPALITMLMPAITPTQTVLTSSINPSVAGQTVTFTATVSSATPTVGIPAGTVQFSVNGAAAGSPIPLNGNGQALFSTGSLPDGQSSILAVYSGDSGFSRSTAPLLVQSVLDFDFTPKSTQSATVFPGQSATFQFTIAPQGAFGNTITFSVSGLPPGSTARFDPASLTPSTTSQTVVLTIQTAQSAVSSRPAPGMTKAPLLFCLLLPLLGIWRVRRFRRRFFVLLTAVASLGISIAISGCVSGGFFSVASHTYSITVTATSGSIQHSTIVDLTVQ